MTIPSTGGRILAGQVVPRVDAPIGPAGNDRLIGTDAADTIFGGLGRDDIFGRGGRDLLHGEDDNDRVFGENGNDRLLGGSGDDVLNGGMGVDRMEGQGGDDLYVVDNVRDVVFEGVDNGYDTVTSFVSYTLAANVEELQLAGTASIDGVGNELDNVISGNLGDRDIANRLTGGLGDDRLFGNSGEDVLLGGEGNDFLSGGADNDLLAGGPGNDVYVVDAIHERVVERPGEGTDLVYTFRDEVLQANVENLTLIGDQDASGSGNIGNNILRGNVGRNLLSGGGGDDQLTGAGGADTLVGGAGADTFVFNTVAETPPGAGRDVVRDFELGVDTLDLTRIDADTAVAGDQAFAFVGNAAYSGVAGELRYDRSVLRGDVNGDGIDDMQITVGNSARLTADDFLL